MATDPTRRRFLKTASCALASIPLVSVSQQAEATINAAARAHFRYQDYPNGNWSCSTCLDFIAGKNDTALGGCKKFPDDNEVSPEGYCVAWNTL